MIEFEWDPEKAERNAVRHGVTFGEASTVFFDDYARQFFDEEHSYDEERFLMLGLSNRSRILIVVHCEREAESDEDSLGDVPVIRIISARRATASERTYYDGPLP